MFSVVPSQRFNHRGGGGGMQPVWMGKTFTFFHFSFICNSLITSNLIIANRAPASSKRRRRWYQFGQRAAFFFFFSFSFVLLLICNFLHQSILTKGKRLPWRSKRRMEVARWNQFGRQAAEQGGRGRHRCTGGQQSPPFDFLFPFEQLTSCESGTERITKVKVRIARLNRQCWRLLFLHIVLITLLLTEDISHLDQVKSSQKLQHFYATGRCVNVAPAHTFFQLGCFLRAGKYQALKGKWRSDAELWPEWCRGEGAQRRHSYSQSESAVPTWLSVSVPVPVPGACARCLSALFSESGLWPPVLE